ncbi:hypothetical protein [Mycolicibacterium fortuitum]
MKTLKLIPPREPERPDEKFLGEVESFDPATGTATIAIRGSRPGDAIALYRGALVHIVTGDTAALIDPYYAG